MEYIPGFWDQLAPSATGFVDKLLRTVNPNHFAQQDFNKIVQQNPQVLQQLSNMNPQERELYAQSLGYKGGVNPFAQMAEGTQSQAAKLDLGNKKRVAGAFERASATPQGQAQVDAALTGTKTPEQLAQEKSTFEMQQKLGQLNLDLSELKKVDLTRSQKIVDAAFAAHPTLDSKTVNATLDAMFKGQPVDPQLANRIQADPGASDLFQLAYKIRLQRMEEEARIRAAAIQKEGNAPMYIRALSELRQDSQRQIALKQGQLQGLVGSFMPEAKAQEKIVREEIARLEAEDAQRAEIAKSLIMSAVGGDKKNPQFKEIVSKTAQPATPFGPRADLAQPSAPPDPEAQLALDAIRQQPAREAAIRAAYKTRTGKNLP